MLLSEIKNVVDQVMESFNARRDLDWKQHGKDFKTSFLLDHQEYELKLEFINFTEFYSEDLPAYEIKFTGKDIDSEKDFSYHGTKTNSTKHAFSVLGIVKNGAMEKLKTLNWKMIYFTAKKNDESYEERVSLYKRMSSLFARENRLNIFDEEFPECNLYILCEEDIKLSKDLIRGIVEQI
jgi:hypothetical protein